MTDTLKMTDTPNGTSPILSGFIIKMSDKKLKMTNPRFLKNSK